MEFFDDLDDAFDALANEVRVRRIPVIRDRQNPLTWYNDEQFKRRFRLRKETIMHLCDILSPVLQHPTHRCKSLSPLLQILLCMRVLAGGSYQIIAGDLIHVSQGTVSNVLKQFLNAIGTLRSSIVVFPNNLAAVKDKFYHIAQFPGVIGCIDGTHVLIKKPMNNPEPEVYRNRKNVFSLNVQLVCGPDLMIYNIVARWPGSTHDSRIFNNCSLKSRIEEGNLRGSGIILGDKGYACTRYMLTPLRNPITEPERRYNASHKSTRCCIERCNGVLKKRFACLQNKLYYEPEKVAAIVICCAVLHNIAITCGDQYVDDGDFIEVNDDIYLVNDNISGMAFRSAFITQHFN